MADMKKLRSEIARIELDTMGRISNTARKAGIPRHKIVERVERLNKEYFNKLQDTLTSLSGE